MNPIHACMCKLFSSCCGKTQQQQQWDEWNESRKLTTLQSQHKYIVISLVQVHDMIRWDTILLLWFWLWWWWTLPRGSWVGLVDKFLDGNGLLNKSRLSVVGFFLIHVQGHWRSAFRKKCRYRFQLAKASKPPNTTHVHTKWVVRYKLL